MNSAKARYTLFIKNIFQDLGFFLFLLLLLSFYRFAFIWVFRETLNASSLYDIWLTMWYGLRISLKTTGACVLPVFVLATLAQVIYNKWPAWKIRFIWGCFCCFVFALLFQTRIPYYQEFQQAFSPFLFNTFHDDVGAIVQTSITQYHAVGRVLLGLLFATVSCVLLKWVLALSVRLSRPLEQTVHRRLVVGTFCVLLVPFAVFLRWGGAFNFSHSIYWKNSARLSQNLLNEAVLDDIQALYKAKKIFKELNKFSRHITSDSVHQALTRLTGKPYQEDSLLPALTRTAAGAKIARPKHIFVIVAETYMLWPLLEPYQYLPIANGLQSIISEPDSIFISHFLSASNGTMFGLTSVLTGLPELNLHTADRPSAQTPFETSLSSQLKKLGYKTRFFYGGYPSWNNVGPFIRNQGFDESYYYADLGGEAGVWGMPDKELFNNMEVFLTDEPSFNYILTSTNHPPYTLDMTKEDVTQADRLRQLLPSKIKSEGDLIQRLQNFEYADKQLVDFVRKMKQKYPDSLFVITGDHADRWTLDPNPSLYERVAVPVVITGKGIRKDMLPSRVSGAHQDIVPTIMELILPKGSTYYALGQDLLTGGQPGLHAYYFITDQIIGDLNADTYEVLPHQTAPSAEEIASVRQRLQDEQTVAVWRVLNGLELTK